MVDGAFVEYTTDFARGGFAIGAEHDFGSRKRHSLGAKHGQAAPPLPLPMSDDSPLRSSSKAKARRMTASRSPRASLAEHSNGGAQDDDDTTDFAPTGIGQGKVQAPPYYHRHMAMSFPLIYQTRAMEERDVRAKKDAGAKSPELFLFLTIGFGGEIQAKLLSSQRLGVSAAVKRAAAERQARRLREDVPMLRRLRLIHSFHNFKRHLEHTFEELTLHGVRVSNQRASELLTGKSQCSLCQARSRRK
jgi:hypothetical protein